MKYDMASVQDERRLSPYRKFLVELSLELSGSDVETLKFAAVDFVPRGKTENITSGLKLFDVLEQDARITPQDLSLLGDMFKTIGRMDLAWRVQCFETSLKDSNNAGRVETDSGTIKAVQELPLSLQASAHCITTGESKNISVSHQKAASLSQSGEGQALNVARVAQALRLQQASSAGKAAVHYVNYLAYQGYSVEIIGGKHFNTPEGEFVEMKSGTQYKIHVSNAHAYGCNLDVFIDGYDVGGWVLDAGKDLVIERPAFEARKFTFYRVKTAPKEAGIESGRSENGVVKCVFTPEAFLDIPVAIPGLAEPLKVNIASSATIGDLKCEIQSQLNASPDPDQILSLDNKVLSNSIGLRNLLADPSENLRLIDAKLQVTVEASSNEVLQVNVHPGRATVHGLMEEIERKLNVHVKDQELYYGRVCLSDTPLRSLPEELICNSEPTVRLLVPEYISISLEDLITGDSSIVKIEEGKTLRDLVKELPSYRRLSENEEVVFCFNGKELRHSKEEETLASLGICSGSKLEFKVEFTLIKVRVAGLTHNVERVFVRPQDTFRDLLKQLEDISKTEKLQGVTFGTRERIFDPDEDTGPLQDYGIKNGSELVISFAKPHSAEDAEELHFYSEINDVHTSAQTKKGATRKGKNKKDKASFLSGIKSKLHGKRGEKTPCHSLTKRRGHPNGALPPPPPSRGAPPPTRPQSSGDISFLPSNVPPPPPFPHVRASNAPPPAAPPPPPSRGALPPTPPQSSGDISFPPSNVPPPPPPPHVRVSNAPPPPPPPPPSRGAPPHPRPSPLFGGISDGISFPPSNVPPPRPSHATPPPPDLDASSPPPLIHASVVSGRLTPHADPYATAPYPPLGQSETQQEYSAICLEDWASDDSQEYWRMSSLEENYSIYEETDRQNVRLLTEKDPVWKAGGTTLQGDSSQRFIIAQPVNADPSRKVELVLRLVAREDETDLVFPKDEFKPLSTLYPPAVPE